MLGARHDWRRTANRGLALVALTLLMLGQAAPDLGDGPDATDDPPPAAPPVYIVPIEGPIDDLTLRFVERGLGEAEAANAAAIVFEMNTPGGQVTAALEICKLIKATPVPTRAWVNPDAYSAGAMISLACDQIIVSNNCRLGDCAPIMVGPQGLQSLGETERAKIESPILAEFRDSARRNNYPEVLCEAMVTLGPAVYRIRNTQTNDQRYVWATQLRQYGLTPRDLGRDPANDGDEPGDDLSAGGLTPAPSHGQRGAVVGQADLEPDTGPDTEPDRDADADPPADADADAEPEAPADSSWVLDKLVQPENTLLTLLRDEAIEYGFAEKSADDEPAMLSAIGQSGAPVVRVQTNWSEQLVRWLTSPFVRGILTIVLLMALYSEMSSPGLGFAGLVAIIAGVILLGAPFLTGLAQAWEIAIIGLGVALLLVEFLVIPGFGIAGISGIILLLLGLIFTFVEDAPGPGVLPNVQRSWDDLGIGAATVLFATIVSIFAAAFMARFFGRIPMLNRLILANQQRAEHTDATPGTSAGVGGSYGVIDVNPGDTGTALGDLRPIGDVEFPSGRIHEVTTGGGWIEAGSPVRVVNIHGSRIEVEQA